MNINFYTTDSERERVRKILNNEISISGTLRNETDIINPTIILSDVDVINKNYCFIPEFNRYYFIQDITLLNNNLYQVTCQVDVLMSYANDIYNLITVVDKQESVGINRYINDGTFKTSDKTFNEIINFPQGFSDTPQYILITAGGATA